jgi:hypothetical protein
MLFLPTLLFGSIFASAFTENIFLGFFLGIFSYFLINLIPHYNFETKTTQENRFVIIFDYIFALIFILFLLFSTSNIFFSSEFLVYGSEVNITISHLFGALGSLLMLGLKKYINNSKKESTIYLKIQKFFEDIEYIDKSAWGISLQFAMTLLTLSILFRLFDFPSWEIILIQLSK